MMLLGMKVHDSRMRKGALSLYFSSDFLKNFYTIHNLLRSNPIPLSHFPGRCGLVTM